MTGTKLRDGLVACKSVPFSEIAAGNTGSQTHWVDMEPAGKICFKLDYKRTSAAQREFVESQLPSKHRVALKRRKIHQVCLLLVLLAIADGCNLLVCLRSMPSDVLISAA